MKLDREIRNTTTIKNSVRRRLLIGGSFLAIAILLGVGKFLYSNLGNNTESLAANNYNIESLSAGNRPMALSASISNNGINLSWLNIVEDKKGVISGTLILRKSLLVCQDQPLEVFEKDPSPNKNYLNGWDILYNGNVISNYVDTKSEAGAFTYLIYLRNNIGIYTKAKDAARIFVLNGANLEETISYDTKIDGLYLPQTCTLQVGKNCLLTINEKAKIEIGGTLVLEGEVKDKSNSLTFNDRSKLIYDYSGNQKTNLPKAIWQSGSTCQISNVYNREPDGLNQTFDNFIWDCNNQETDVMMPEDFNVNGNFTINATGKSNKELIFSNSNIFKGDIILNEKSSNVVLKSKSNFILNGTVKQLINGNWEFQNITFNNPDGFVVNNQVKIQKLAYLESGEINFNNPTQITFEDNASIHKLNGSFANTPIFNGVYDLTYLAAGKTGNELVDNDIALRHVSINLNGNIMLNKSMNVNGCLELLNGKILTGNNEVNLKNNSPKSLKASPTSSYVIGNLRRSINGKSSYDFPVGSDYNLELITVDLAKTEGFNSLLARFNNTKPDEKLISDDLRLNGSPVNKILDNGYWSLIPNGNITAGFYNVTLNQKGQTNKALNERCYCIVKRDNASSLWNFNGKHSMKSQNEKNKTTTAARFQMNSFGDLAIGYTPVSILLYQATFTATLINNEYTEIIWRTSVENNFASLLLERSADSYTYEPLGELKESTPKGSSIEFALNDTKPLPGLNYYRVKQTDKSGKTSYSSVSYVNFMQSLESVGNTKQNNN